MPVITLPDGNELKYDAPVTGLQVATDISPGLAKVSIAVKLGDDIKDLNTTISEDTSLKIIKADNEDPDALFVLRHSCAHVMAEAICDIFPETKLAYGPPIENGFFYDLSVPESLSQEHFPEIEKRMQAIVDENRPFTRCEYDADGGLARVGEDKYKRDNAERALAKGDGALSFYTTGEKDKNWEDLCAGPHVPSTGFLKAFKIQNVAGAYWHGDQDSDQLTRVYGTCFADKKGLKRHLQLLEEAAKRDHRKLGKEMDLFHIPEDNPGQIFWHHKGWTLYRLLMDYMREKLFANDYIEVHTPSVMARSLWERSGHWEKFREDMFTTQSEDRDFAIKPMNCPGHIEIFKKGLKSYRDLPLRMAEFGSCCRNELSGTLHGTMRVRGFVQDDAHIFCREEQVGEEVANFCTLLKEVYTDFGFAPEQIRVKFSTRPEKRVGDDATWDRAEKALEEATRAAGIECELNPGEGAFYGPKLEFVLRDCLNRDWQCGTIQADYHLASAARLDATYVGEDGNKHHPVLLHRAVLGAFERFIGILIEHYAGKFPLWLAPVQVRVLQITDEQADYSKKVHDELKAAGIRVELDTYSEKLGAKIRRARNDRIPYFLVIGAKEVEDNVVALQKQTGEKCGNLSVTDLIDKLKGEISARQ